MTYTTGLLASKALKEKGIEIESEMMFFHWKDDDKNRKYRWGTSHMLGNIHCSRRIGRYIPSYSLSELAEVFKVLGEKLGWESIYTPQRDCEGNTWDEYEDAWLNHFKELCEIWATTRSQERCDDYIKQILTQ